MNDNARQVACQVVMDQRTWNGLVFEANFITNVFGRVVTPGDVLLGRAERRREQPLVLAGAR